MKRDFAIKHLILRQVWILTWAIFCKWTPPFMWKWRRFFLVLFGAKLATRCDVRRNANVWYPPNLIMHDGSMLAENVNCYNVGFVELKEGSLVSQGAYICTASHDVNNLDFALVVKPVVIDKWSWVASEAFVGPGVHVGSGAVLAARSAAFSNLEAWSIYRGNPAQFVRARPMIYND